MDFAVFVTIVFNLFLIVDPVGCIPLFAAITRNDSPQVRRRMVRRAIVIAFAVLALFALAGSFLLRHFGIGAPAVRIAGGFLLFGIGIEMLYGRVSRTETTEKEEEEAAGKSDVSVTPLAIPLLAGPGSIAGVILFAGTLEGAGGSLVLLAAIALVMLLSWAVLSLTEGLIRIFGQIGIRVIARVMGLLLLFLATQFVLDGVKATGLFAR